MGKFYWECNGEHYNFRKDKRYLIYYRGYFSPCTRGHFSVVKQFVDTAENIDIMIHQIGEIGRHGIPYWLNRKIWKIYIHELLPKNRIYLVKCDRTRELLDYVDDIDVVVYVRGNEDYIPQLRSQKTSMNYGDIERALKRRGIRMDYVFLERPLKHVLSASLFIKELLKQRDNDRINYDKLNFYLPENLSRKACRYIVRKLMKENIK